MNKGFHSETGIVHIFEPSAIPRDYFRYAKKFRHPSYKIAVSLGLIFNLFPGYLTLV